MLVTESKTYAKTQCEAVEVVAKKRYDRAMQEGWSDYEAANIACEYLRGIMERHATKKRVQHTCRQLLQAYAA